jgi:DNA polymerase III epsilon subunit-like protein
MTSLLKAGRRKQSMDEHLLRYNKNKTFVLIDCETFNLCLNFCHNLPWQIGLVKARGDSKVDSKNYYINWDTNLKISEDAARITRYDHNKVKKLGLKIEEVFPTIKDWLDHADYIIGHNILGFDIYLIKELYQKMGCHWDHLMNKVVDTNCLARGIKYGIPYKSKQDLLEYQYKIYHTRRKDVKSSLSLLGKENGIEHDYERLHDALNDLDLNLKIWNKLKWQVEI